MIRSNRTRRATLKARSLTNRAQARIRRTGVGTLASHCLATGLSPRDARTVAGSLRNNAVKAGVAGIPGVAYRKGRARPCLRYTAAQVGRIAVIYRPRRDLFKTAAARLALAA
ncbi:hypothetical protein ACIQNU_04310 [Streptomyces sp. NPDC091292]|uniref:hypothetical protein n=1 Tax=Streptomyces sp. NPDC091292 TaxID=3365991 RepID=UPI0038103520